MTRHFLRDDDLTPAEQAEVLALAKRLKKERFAERPLAGPRTVAVVFDKPTLRTQLSFATGISELGGYPMVVDGNLAKIGTRESVADVARVLGPQTAAIVWRTFDQSRIDEMAEHAGVPVVNALTDQFHPCQLLADLQTVEEHKGSPAGRTMVFLGDTASNMSHSYLLAGATAGMHVRVSGPEEFAPDAAILTRAEEIAAGTGGSVAFVVDPAAAVAGADVVATDTWVSMGKEGEADERSRPFVPYALTADLLAKAADDAIVLHCLPAYRGKEIAADVIDGPQSVVWDEAENRLHAQKALLTWLLAHQGPTVREA
ncbi:ornithine carbamoyltransferase [Nocardioides iriomotensis]|uniref:Ornithine carbamoyltransferase n=1 Tax=Nocardioides iriomotensis TaxID=715784 RepID=A0A4Q5IYQ2_9ACTN|nr:ornithine carbamoyltransferase [Nocardioides iriomotensis]RYU11143.1 ornithine carbamoyltransferase [Nocardioides iriomotensis]